jgi:hypothetical protein
MGPKPLLLTLWVGALWVGALWVGALTFVVAARASAAPLDEARRSTIRCAGECPEAVGAMVVITENERGVVASNFCGVTLVAPDLLVTASHCLDATVFAAGRSCAESVVVLFPATAEHPAESPRCERIETMTPTRPGPGRETTHLDHAFVRLSAPLQRTPTPPSGDGLERDALLTMYPPRDESGRDEGAEYAFVLEERRCEVALGAISLPGFDGPRTGYGLLAPCRVILGNSGTGVLASDGTVRGVVSARDDWPSPHAFARTLFANGQRPAGAELPTAASTAVVSNLACATLPGARRPRGSPRECAATSYRDIAQLRRAIARRWARSVAALEREVQQARRVTARWARAASSGRWAVRIERQPSRILVHAVPSCRTGTTDEELVPSRNLRVQLDRRFHAEVVETPHTERVSLRQLPLCQSRRGAR